MTAIIKGQANTTLKFACLQDGWKSVFDTFDENHDGSISEPEIRVALAKVGVTDAEVASLLQQYDTNKCATSQPACHAELELLGDLSRPCRDGQIDLAEFEAMMRSTDQELKSAASW